MLAVVHFKAPFGNIMVVISYHLPYLFLAFLLEL